MRNELLKKLKDDKEKMGLRELARQVDMPATTLFKLLNGERSGNIKTWEKVINFYGRKHLYKG